MFARIVDASSLDLLRLHLRRLGVEEGQAEDACRSFGNLDLLVTAAPAELLLALAQSGVLPRVAIGDPDRARGTALLSGTVDQLEAAARWAEGAGGAAPALARAIRRCLQAQARAPEATSIGGRLFAWGQRTYVMGILNVTPDSFSDGGRFLDVDAAVAAGERLAAAGADLIDIGGESTRPGAEPVEADEELARVLPVVERLAKRVQIPLSIDTTKAKVAEAAVGAGASLVNDVSGFRFDEQLAPTVARLGVPAVVMHLQGTPRTMQQSPRYLDLVGEVLEGLHASLDHAERCGIPAGRLLVDPGIGFGKTGGNNLFLLRALGQLRALGRPILVGVSRKGFLGALTGLPVGERLPASLAALTASVLNGADVVRVHDVAESVAAARIADAVMRAREAGMLFEAAPA